MTDDLDIDFGNIEMPELDPDIFNIDGIEDHIEETRYIKPHATYVKPDHIMYDNAVKLARDLTIGAGERFDAIVSGNFIFGDFIEAYIVEHNALVPKLTITTLSLSQDNVDSLRNLLEGGYVQELNLIVSAYFFANERHALIPYIYQELDIDDRFQLAVCGIHTKTCHFNTSGGKHVVIHGSANMRSSGNIEQFTIEDNEQLFNFYDDYSEKMLEYYKTIQKPIRGNQAWNEITKKKFND